MRLFMLLSGLRALPDRQRRESGCRAFHPKIRSSNEDFHRKGAEVAEGTLRRVCVSGYCRAFFTAIPFHPLGEPSSSIVFPKFLSSHMQGSAWGNFSFR
jgi:hypothetical protein